MDTFIYYHTHVITYTHTHTHRFVELVSLIYQSVGLEILFYGGVKKQSGEEEMIKCIGGVCSPLLDGRLIVILTTRDIARVLSIRFVNVHSVLIGSTIYAMLCSVKKVCG